MLELLPDVQNRPDTRGIALYRVGIEGLRLPIRVWKKPPTGGGERYTIDTQADARLYVDLDPAQKGVNMSRFVETLMEYKDRIVTKPLFPELLSRLRERMGSEDAFVELDFVYFMEKYSPVSQKPATMGYDVGFIGWLTLDNGFEFFQHWAIPVQTCCPCSAELTLLENLQTEEIEFRGDIIPDIGRFKEGKPLIGMGAHNQRTVLRVDVETAPEPIVWLEDVIAVVEECGSVPLYPLLKRVDERYVTMRGYRNPKFVEDVVRDVGRRLDTFPGVTAYSLKAVSQESIHDHNAVAYLKSTNWKLRGGGYR